MNEEITLEYQSMGPEYVTAQIEIRILQLYLRGFYCLIFMPRKFNMP